MTMEEASRLWSEVLDSIKQSVEDYIFTTWFKHLELMKLQDRSLILRRDGCLRLLQEVGLPSQVFLTGPHLLTGMG